MAFPTWVVGPWQGSTTTNATSTTITLPTTRNVGDRIIAWVTLDGNAGVTWPTGWTSVFAVADSTAAAIHQCAYRDWTGTETAPQGSGGTIAPTHANQMGSWVTAKVNAGTFDPATAPAFQTALGSTLTPDPPSLDPAGWGTEDTAWVASSGFDNAGVRTYTTPVPSGYTAIGQSVGANGQSTGTAVARIDSAVGSVNPGTFTINGTGTPPWIAATVAIRPLSPIVSRTFAVSGVATPSVSARGIASRTFTVAAVATVVHPKPQTTQLKPTALAGQVYGSTARAASPIAGRTFSVVGVATSTFLPRPLQRRLFTVSAVATASFATLGPAKPQVTQLKPTALAGQLYGSTARAVSGLASRTFAVSAVATAAFTSKDIERRTFAVAAVATSTALSRDIERRSFAVTAVATATVLSKDIERRSFAAVAVATATGVSRATVRRTFATIGVATAAFSGINAASPVASRTFAVSAVATSTALSRGIARRTFTSPAVATAAFTARGLARRTFAAIGVARATFSAINLGAGPAPRTFEITGVATATFLPRPRQIRTFTTAAVARATVHGIDATAPVVIAWLEATYSAPNLVTAHRSGPAPVAYRAPSLVHTWRASPRERRYKGTPSETTVTAGV